MIYPKMSHKQINLTEIGKKKEHVWDIHDNMDGTKIF